MQSTQNKNRLFFVVPGHPIPAVRMTQMTKWTDPRAQRYLGYKLLIKEIAGLKAKGMFFEHARVNIKVFYKGRGGDVDNYIKSVLDGCNEVIWKDDIGVLFASCEKCKVAEEALERVEVEVIEV